MLLKHNTNSEVHSSGKHSVQFSPLINRVTGGHDGKLDLTNIWLHCFLQSQGKANQGKVPEIQKYLIKQWKKLLNVLISLREYSVKRERVCVCVCVCVSVFLHS